MYIKILQKLLTNKMCKKKDFKHKKKENFMNREMNFFRREKDFKKRKCFKFLGMTKLSAQNRYTLPIFFFKFLKN